MIIQQTSVWCLSAIVLWVLSTPLLPNLNGDTGPKHRAINSYTTTGQFAAVSSAHKAGWLHNHSSVVPAAKTRAQSAPTTRPLLCTAHSSSSSQKDSAVQGQVGKKMQSSEIPAAWLSFHALVNLPRVKQHPALLWWPATDTLKIPTRQNQSLRPYMYTKERWQGSRNTVIRPPGLSGLTQIFTVQMSDSHGLNQSYIWAGSDTDYVSRSNWLNSLYIYACRD